MKKFGYLVAAVVAAGIIAPSMASAETVVIKHRDHGPRAEMRHRDHGMGHHSRKVVVIKERHRHHRY